MDELTWEMLAEVYGRMNAELLKSYLEANGVEVELIQEAVGHLIFPTTIKEFGSVQVFVEKKNIKKARKLFEGFEI